MSKRPAVTTKETHFVRDHCLCLAAQRAARALSRRFDEAFRPFGITSGQFSLLNALNRLEPPPLGAVARLLAMDRTTLTANLKPLERRGLVAPVADPRDRRVRRLALTPTGREVLAEALPVWRTVHAEIDLSVPNAEDGGRTLREGLAALL
ncbi:MarR family winged helix-turn-helix transcriptional regulator [Sphingosinicella rhizophila]|uniref:MarR family winged helix-turn-helix transcriptional regulator n=1 Tax=Sphingosinicella rhizophila TaxID=3050082 RepID=A0ABU3QB40_9SPHN|nr:MarR family winged helix-turn-helix transcriptional regulator [Sphingosinicella sp. GR2756]MDT9600609.1 MarR family winged helix-turn-helix transcriptional regulator [Sphingosinicella sp. GR2756]